ncbi:hypothetical protein Q428_01880 [Fervidicella metallireducens AeB]|uniref:Uncharacterized protein n=1 Tax=Fervidicella metallireducens AeB TaxID=1403537 RepID=A0A017RYG2_9CLOT|nr:hypothetical protein Q428_01880 [Fervidicella metallireducens AeB]
MILFSATLAIANLPFFLITILLVIIRNIKHLMKYLIKAKSFGDDIKIDKGLQRFSILF